MPENELVAERLKNLRKKKGASVEEMSLALNISRSAICMYESGNRIPRDEVKVKIANYFNTTVEDIFFRMKCHKK
ncbi:helix-turn-helix transcriptional regulator [Amedibacterium intestinale]|uniref:helix-turn-helix transcriptional regulator n=1 Tax=Amedibacterium intestinale TaxID=2583452 RepID=UPI000E20B181